jgi:hypothetical protein
VVGSRSAAGFTGLLALCLPGKLPVEKVFPLPCRCEDSRFLGVCGVDFKKAGIFEPSCLSTQSYSFLFARPPLSGPDSPGQIVTNASR